MKSEIKTYGSPQIEGVHNAKAPPVPTSRTSRLNGVIHMDTALIPVNEPPREFGGGIRFVMSNGRTRIICWISRQALDTLDRSKCSEEEPTMCFERHRCEIERLANQKYASGESQPKLLSFDLSEPKPLRFDLSEH
jgi:Protein of unknown function (DUF1488)